MKPDYLLAGFSNRKVLRAAESLGMAAWTGKAWSFSVPEIVEIFLDNEKKYQEQKSSWSREYND